MLYLIAGGVTLAGIFVYLLFMVFLPEWVGITGKTALDNERSHRGENEGNPSAEAAAPTEKSE